jgi:RNA polymerase sigma-70 factor (ECF subfamily)
MQRRRIFVPAPGNHPGVASVPVERGDREFEALYRRHAAEVYRYALAVLHNAVDAEDVTQQTFMNAYRALLRGEKPRTPLNWLVVIAHNVCRERLRQSLRRPKEVELDESVRATPHDEGRWTVDEIRRALSQLASNQRAAIVLRELEGRSYAEIAQILGTSQSATEALAFRARRALREQLEGELSCDEAQAAVRRRLKGGLPHPEQGALRAHLRECRVCAAVARSERGRRKRRVGGLAGFAFPLPLKWLFGGGAAPTGAASVGSGIAVKAAVVAAAGAVATGVGYEGVRHASRAASAAAPEHTVVRHQRRASRAVAAPVWRASIVLRTHPVRTQRAVKAIPRPAHRAELAQAPRAEPRAAHTPTVPVAGSDTPSRPPAFPDPEPTSAPAAAPKATGKAKADPAPKHKEHGNGRSQGAPGHSGLDPGPPAAKGSEAPGKAKGHQPEEPEPAVSPEKPGTGNKHG